MAVGHTFHVAAANIGLPNEHPEDSGMFFSYNPLDLQGPCSTQRRPSAFSAREVKSLNKLNAFVRFVSRILPDLD